MKNLSVQSVDRPKRIRYIYLEFEIIYFGIEVA